MLKISQKNKNAKPPLQKKLLHRLYHWYFAKRLKTLMTIFTIVLFAFVYWAAPSERTLSSQPGFALMLLILTSWFFYFGLSLSSKIRLKIFDRSFALNALLFAVIFHSNVSIFVETVSHNFYGTVPMFLLLDQTTEQQNLSASAILSHYLYSVDQTLKGVTFDFMEVFRINVYDYLNVRLPHGFTNVETNASVAQKTIDALHRSLVTGTVSVLIWNCLRDLVVIRKFGQKAIGRYRKVDTEFGYYFRALIRYSCQFLQLFVKTAVTKISK